MRDTTLDLPEGRGARAGSDGARTGTGPTAIVRDHPEAIPARGSTGAAPDVLTAFAGGLVSREEALSALGLRDYAALLVVLGDHGLAPPRPPDPEIENQAAAFERLWRSA